MARANRAYQCFVCKRVFPPEQLGRCELPLWSRRGRWPRLRLVCVNCYSAMVDCYPDALVHNLPALHGF